MMTREEKVRESHKQWEEGAITYIEFAFFIYSLITEEDVQEREELRQAEKTRWFRSAKQTKDKPQ